MKAAQIKKLRQKMGLTQAKFAPLAHANRVTLARWETGAHQPRGVYLALLRRLAKEVKGKK